MVRIVDMTPHPSVVKQTTCGNCGVTLEYVPRDVQRRTSRDYGGGTDVTEYVKCPCCSHDIVVRMY